MTGLRRKAREAALRFLGYAGISGLGWLGDLALFAALLSAGAPPFAANMASSGLVAGAVFLISGRRLFGRTTGVGLRRLPAWLLWQGALITAASSAVAWLAANAAAPVLAAKVAVTAGTLCLNYLVAATLFRRPAGIGRT